MKEYKHIFKRWIQRMYIDSARKMDYERGHRSKYELDCLSICKKLIDIYTCIKYQTRNQTLISQTREKCSQLLMYLMR